MSDFWKKCLLILTLFVISISASAGQGRLGLTVAFTAQRTTFDARMDRLVINGVEKDSPAIRAGLMSGDIIESLNGMTVTGQSGRKLFKAMAAIRTGDSVRMTVLRGGKRLSVSMVAG